MIMTILSATIMMNIKYDKPKVFHLIFGILLSVTIYYIHYFLTVLGKTEKLPITVSIWMPIILLTIISSKISDFLANLHAISDLFRQK